MAWERLAHVALSTAGDTLDSGTFTAKKNMQVIIHIKDTGTANVKLQVNSFTGAGYSYRYSESGSSDTTAINQNDIRLYETGSGTDVQRHIVLNIQNMVNKVKTIMGEVTEATATGAGTAPTRVEVAGSFEENPLITSIQIKNDASGSFAAGSYITVLGAKESSQSQEITVDSLAAKKHLMVQAKLIPTSALDGALRFNGDSGSNYATRDSRNGANNADASTTGFNLTAGHSPSQPYFVTYYIINEAGKEKLAVGEIVYAEGAGAGTAPRRMESTGKWANTSNAISSITFRGIGYPVSTDGYAEGSEVTVYGTD